MENKRQNTIRAILLLFLFDLFSTLAQAAPPINDNFANALEIGSGSSFYAHFTGTNTEATKEWTEPHHGDNPDSENCRTQILKMSAFTF